MARRKNDQDRTGGQQLPTLPEHLRLRPDADADCDAWRAARRAWEREHGMTIREWWRAQLAAARATGTLEGLNRPWVDPGPPDDEYERDPRLQYRHPDTEEES